MKSAIQKTDELLEQIMYCDFRTETGIDKAKNLIRMALKNQDSESRHDCIQIVAHADESGEQDVLLGSIIRRIFKSKLK